LWVDLSVHVQADEMGGSSKLSAVGVAKLKKPGRYGDGGGLWLQVTEGTSGPTKCWLFRYMLDGRARAMGLGPLDTFSLAEARERARDARQLVKDGIDPIDAKRAKRQAAKATAARQITFTQAGDAYIEAHRAGWRSSKHADQWRATLAAFAVPIIGDLSVASVETAHVLRILEPIWTTRTVTATRVRGRIESVLDWAKARGYRAGENPARWRGHLDVLLPAASKVSTVTHHPAMPYADLPAFMAELRNQNGISARALEITILTAARTGEVINARWPEVDFSTRVWTVPAERMKANREHRVPLSGRAIAILQALPRDGSDWVFAGDRAGRPLSDAAMLSVLKSLRPELDVHGLRSSFRDWAAETTGFPREIAEAALAHVVGDSTERAYRRTDALERRRKMMEAWARFCERPMVASAKVVAIRP
jgi:integrase